ncbi:MAG: hypothetical protein QOH70_1926 [Blastocatellia bacterium]|jgi:hypothetical protein|nr:hypothetical protein [Blastocatellia bacterium]
MAPKQVLEVIVLVVQIISFPVAAVSLYLTRKEAKAGRDLQIALNLSESFRSRWEGGWSDALYKVKEAQKASRPNEVPLEHRDHLFQMLNWIDWLGVLIKTKSLSKKEIIFDSIGPQFVEIIDIGRPLIESDIRKHGSKYWAGLLTVAQAQDVEWTRGY